MIPDQPASPLGAERRSPRGLELLALLLEHRRFIGANVLAVTAFALIVSLLLPRWYRATATVLPPKQPDLFGALSSVNTALRSIPGAVRFGTQRQTAYNYLAILNSRTAMETVVRKFELVTVYDVADSSVEMAIKELRSNVTFEESSNDELVIDVLDREPRHAADMANTFVDVLNDISIRMGTTEARSNREFIGRRVLQARVKLSENEDELRKYQERTGLIITPEQNASLSAVGGLYAARTKKEVELAILLQQVTEENPLAVQLRNEVTELARRIEAIPAAGMTSLRLYREVIIQQKILEFLVPLEEQARIDEQKTFPWCWSSIGLSRRRRKTGPNAWSSSSWRLLSACSLPPVSWFSGTPGGHMPRRTAATPIVCADFFGRRATSSFSGASRNGGVRGDLRGIHGRSAAVSPPIRLRRPRGRPVAVAYPVWAGRDPVILIGLTATLLTGIGILLEPRVALVAVPVATFLFPGDILAEEYVLKLGMNIYAMDWVLFFTAASALIHPPARGSFAGRLTPFLLIFLFAVLAGAGLGLTGGNSITRLRSL